MKFKSGIYIVGLAFLLTSAGPVMVSAAGAGKGSQGNQVSVRTMQHERVQLRDGSCVKGTRTSQAAGQKRGNTYGPGNGTGNQGSGPKDGTGYGSSSKKAEPRKQGNAYGPGDGTGNAGIGPKDGTGYGAPSQR